MVHGWCADGARMVRGWCAANGESEHLLFANVYSRIWAHRRPAEAPVGPEPVRAGESLAAAWALNELVTVAVQVIAVREFARPTIYIDPVAREVAPEK